MYSSIRAVILAVAATASLSAFAQGQTVSVADSLATDTAYPSAKVSFRRQVREQRGISNLKTHIVPKGQWVFGGSLTYSTHVNNDYKFLVIEDINSKGYSVKVSPLIGYSLVPNSILGVRGAYSRSNLNMDSASLHLGEGDAALNFGVDYYYMLKHSYSASAFWRQYIPLGTSKRIGLFAEMLLTMGGSQSKFEEGAPIRGTFSRSFDISVGVNPGIVAFMTNNMAIEINIGVLGIGYSLNRQVHNQITTGKTSSSMMNFKVNLLSVGIGAAFYL